MKNLITQFSTVFLFLILSCKDNTGSKSSKTVEQKASLIEENKFKTCEESITAIVKSSNAIAFKSFDRTKVNVRIENINTAK